MLRSPIRNLLKCDLLPGIKTKRSSVAPYFNKSINRLLATDSPRAEKEQIEVTFRLASGKEIKAKGAVGDSLLDLVVNNNLDLDGFGACEGTLTCSTCHLIFEKADYDRIREKPTDEELDMLDLAYELTETSRLGCQVTLTKELDGLVVRVPAGVNDVRNS